MPVDRAVRARLVAGAVQLARQRAVEDFVHQRRLARTAHAGHRGQHAERESRRRCPCRLFVARPHDQRSRPFAAVRRCARRLESRARRAGTRPVSESGPRSRSCRGRALEDHLAAVLAGARARGRRRSRRSGSSLRRARRRCTVLPRSRSRVERREQAPVVALVEADRRLVEDVQHAGQVRADLRRQPDALPFAARERRGARDRA